MSKLTLETLRALRGKKQMEMKPSQTDFQVNVGMGTCGVAAGSQVTLEAIQSEVAAKGVKNVVVRQTGCMGLCFTEPVVEVVAPGKAPVIYGGVTADVAKKIVAGIADGKPFDANILDKPSADILSDDCGCGKKQFRIVLRNCGVIDPDKIDEYIAREGYQGLERALFELTPDQVIDELNKSGLRGRGGAGFPTGRKWAFSKQVASDQKYIVCNADEGDPGAYMDRSTLEGDPHSILEAMAIAGRAIGADKGYIYIRAEYPLAIKRLETAIAQARAYGLLGADILGSGFNFDIEMRFGAGAFVCGEETALLASIEGKRGMPTPRPPFPAVKGLWGKPTVINNVETLANIPVILTKGGDWYAKVGTATTKGTKVFALTGKVKNSGLVEVPMGTTLREIIFEIGGGIKDDLKFKAAQTGGPSGGVIPPQFLDTPIDYESLAKIGSIMGSGGLIVTEETDCIVDIAKFYLDFTVDESCGKCAPCRIGGRSLLNILVRISEGKGELKDLDDLKAISVAMQRASLCGLGQTASNPVQSMLRYFLDEVKSHILDKKCPAGKCKKLIAYTINDKCKGCTACARKCPVGAITGEVKKPHVIDQAKCVKCGVCLEVCKFGAVTRG
ncbi:MAG: NADH-quinone oxidoreductase subunit NuoF [Kiritimatiellaeota bacterium]|nr:NADH-quinone oxidoreductase subunit NuoF [Kiritimatiellota bacterium]